MISKIPLQMPAISAVNTFLPLDTAPERICNCKVHLTKVLYQRKYSCGHFGSLVSIWKWLRSFHFYARTMLYIDQAGPFVLALGHASGV